MPDRPDSPAGPAAPLRLCQSKELREAGKALVFDVLLYGQPARAFALRFKGQVVAYLNRCVHVPAEMDWRPGEFMNRDRRFIICSIHGAEYEPLSGECAGGPCGRGKLMPIQVSEVRKEVYWYPSADIRPVNPPA